MTPDQNQAILQILDGARDMTLATVREDGYPQATTVSFVHDGLAIYFGCGRESQKARNLRRCDKVSLTVDLPYERWEEIRGLSLGGRAQEVTEPAELRRVFEAMVARFPEISAYSSGDGLEQAAVFRIDPEVISLLDYRKGFGHTEEIEAGSRRSA